MTLDPTGNLRERRTGAKPRSSPCQGSVLVRMVGPLPSCCFRLLATPIPPSRLLRFAILDPALEHLDPLRRPRTVARHRTIR